MKSHSALVDYQHPEACVVVMTRAPVMGEVKTRLIPALGEEKTTLLFRYLLERLLSALGDSSIAPLEVWTTDTEHDFFLRYKQEENLQIKEQRGGELGERLYCVFEAVSKRYPYVVIIGSDIPELGPEDIGKAIELLNTGDDAVFMPAEDGGYGLVGLRMIDRHLFHNIPWGGAEVMEQTRCRLKELGWSWSELTPCWDLDTAVRMLEEQQLAGA